MRCAYSRTDDVEIHSFALFADTILKLRVDEIESTTIPGAKVLKGTVVSASGGSGGTFAISVYQGAVAASFTLEGEGGSQTYMVGGDPQVRDAFVAHQTDHSLYLPERDVASGDEPAVEMSSPTESFQTRTASGVAVTVDLLVGFTTNALKAAGSRSQMIATLNLAISETTTINSNSQLTTLQFRMVGVSGPYNLADSGVSSVLNTIGSTSNTVGADLATKRTAVGADAVMMITDSTDACGVAWLMNPLSDSFKTSAFSVAKYSCATGYYTFAHELGHNLGVTHNSGVSSQGIYSYGFGWRWSSDTYRSVMSYSPGTRLKYWSNPDVTNNGQPTGDAANGDNVRALEEAKGTAAGWYPAAMCSGLSQAYCTDAKNPNCQWTGSACTCTSSTGCITEMASWDLAGIAICGNAIIEGGEECDDGNSSDGDYCSANCIKISRVYTSTSTASSGGLC
jgi:peptidyl-Asp metalloendopeptidase